MQNMISVEKDDKRYSVLFDINEATKDFDNIRVRDETGEPLLALYRADIEALKDIIAEEISLAVSDIVIRREAGLTVYC